MIDLQHLFKNPQFYRDHQEKRWKDGAIIDEIVRFYRSYKINTKELDVLRTQKNQFNETIHSLSENQKKKWLLEMKEISARIKELEDSVHENKQQMDLLIGKVANPLDINTPLGKSDDDNIPIQVYGTVPSFDFEVMPYRELPVYKKYVKQEEGAFAMWSRGYYLTWEIARFQKVLFDYALDMILQSGYELFYVPLMLNDKVLTWTGHLPDFDGQQYEIMLTENKSYYLIWSSEPSIMWYFMNKNLGDLEKPLFITAQTSCFRKEAWSYGKDQQGILRVHQFEKIEMVVLCRPEDVEDCFNKQAEINEYIWNSLGVCFRKVEVCSWDMPAKHTRQQDYEARFPAVQKFREIGSNGNASDYQNRGLKITYMNDENKKAIPFGLNDTGMTFRTWLAILEQNQQRNGSVKIPEVLRERFGKAHIE